MGNHGIQGGQEGGYWSSLPFVVGRDHPILYTYELPCSRGRAMCYKHSGLMATWPVCMHTHVHPCGLPLGF